MIKIKDCDFSDGNYEWIGDLIKNYGLSSKFTEMFELYINGEKNFLLVGNKTFYIMSFKNGVDQFSVVDNQIVYYHCSNSGISLKGGAIYKLDYQNRVQDCIDIRPYTGDEVKYQSVNASLNYVHFNYDEGLKYVLSYCYNASFDDKDKISTSFFFEPFYVGIKTLDGIVKNKDKEYYLTHWYEEDGRYSVALMKTVGFVNFLTTNYSGEIDVYYDRNVKGNYSLVNLMNSKQYDLDDIEDILIENGLEDYVPSQDLIDSFNREDDYYKMLLEIYKKYVDFKKQNVYIHKLAM